MAGISIIAKCKSVTPMVTSGADNTRFELRTPAVKSGLRFWWRAFHAFPDETTLYAEESKLFGGVIPDPDDDKAKPKVIGSSFRIRVRIQPGTDLPVPWEDVGLGQVNAPKSYLYFPLRPTRQPWPANCDRAAMPDFEIAITGIPSEEAALDLLSALWLLEHLGGIGGRTRHGAGGFQTTELRITGFDRKGIPPYRHTPPVYKNEEAFKTSMHDSLDWITKRWMASGVPSERPYTAWSSSAKVWLIPGPSAHISDLLDSVAQEIKDFRKADAVKSGGNFHAEAKAMHQRIGDAIAGATPCSTMATPFAKPAFGLPIQYHFGSLRGKPEPIMFEAAPDADKQNRRAAPLFLSFGKGVAHKADFAWCMVTFLPATFLPGHMKVKYTARLDEKPVIARVNKLPPGSAAAKELEPRLTAAKTMNMQDVDFLADPPADFAVVRECAQKMAKKLKGAEIYP